MINIGFACKLIGYPNLKMRSCVLRNAYEQNLIDISMHNIDVLRSMVDYCNQHDIKLMRISSDIIPFASHAQVGFDWRNILLEQLQAVGELIHKAGLRVSMHPGQYTVLNSPNEHVVDAAIRDITWHANFLESLYTDNAGKIVLHVGGLYGDKASSIARFIHNFARLPKHAKNRLVIENDERNYNIEDVLLISKQLHIPAVFDVLHHGINPPTKNDPVYWIKESAKTWRTNDGVQKIHYSQQKLGAKTGAHSDTIDLDIFLHFYRQISEMTIDIMLEVKDKNISAIKCINAIKSTAS